MVDKEKTTPIAELVKAFESWVEGRTGLTITEYVEMYSRFAGLTPTQTKDLKAEEKKKEDEKRRAKEAKDKEEAERKKKEEEAAKKAKEAKEKEEAAKKKKGVEAALIISRTPYPKWWKDARTWNININNAGTWTIVPKTPGYRTYIGNIVFTVSGETNIVLQFGIFPPTGPMNFGGEGQPMGIVIAMGDSPAPCGDGGFIITSDGAGVLVSGFITYYYETEKLT